MKALSFIGKVLLATVCLTALSCGGDDNTQASAQTTGSEDNPTTSKMYITIDGKTQSITLADNQATRELVSRLRDGDVTVALSSNGDFEIWGSLGFSLPANDQQIKGGPGDVVLYNSHNICLFYGSSSWSYTRLGKIDGLSENELRTFLKAGESGIAVTLSLNAGTSATGK